MIRGAYKDSDIGPIPSTWELQAVDEIKSVGKSLISGPFGSNISSRFFVSSGVPVIRGNNLSLDVGIRFIDCGFAYITQEKALELGTWAKKDDLVFTAVGTIGQVGILEGKQKYSEYIISNKQLRLTVDSYKLLPRFAYYWFTSPFMQENIISQNTGSSVPLINLGILRALPVPIPPLPEQKAIAAVLSSLDDKIDLLHRQNATLEAMAEALFSRLFIAAASGKNLSAITEWISFNPKRSIAKGYIAPYLEMSNVNTTTFHPSDIAYKEFSSGMQFLNGDTLLARITPCLENGKTCYVTFLENEQVGWGSTEYIVMRSNASLHPFFSYCLAKTDDFRGYAENCLTGSSGRQRVDAEHLKQYEIVSPTEQSIEEFNDLATSIVPKLHNNFVQIRTLEKLRDTLLPKFMSGEVRVEC